MSSEIDRVARTCIVIECNAMGIMLMSGYARVSGASIGPLGYGTMQLPTADVAASPGKRSPGEA